jgi:hypothetical protein
LSSVSDYIKVNGDKIFGMAKEFDSRAHNDRNMRLIFFISLGLLFSITTFGQKYIFISYENGGLFERYKYLNSESYTLNQYSIGGILGLSVTYSVDSLAVETGLYDLSSYEPWLEYDYRTASASSSLIMFGANKSWFIPLRIGKVFSPFKKFFFKPELGINLHISREYVDGQPFFATGENVRPPFLGTNFTPSGPDSTLFYGTFPSKFHFGIEASLSAGYWFRKKMAVYMKLSYMATFNPTYYETITHYSESREVFATRTKSSAFLLQVGLKYQLFKLVE